MCIYFLDIRIILPLSRQPIDLLAQKLKPMVMILSSTSAAPKEETISLKTVISRLVQAVSPETIKNRSFIINEVPEELQIASNSLSVTAVLGKVFVALSRYSYDSCIRVSTKIYSNVVLVQFRNKNNLNAYALTYNLQSAQPIAESIGGYVDITSTRKKETTIVFGFQNRIAV